MKVSIITYHWEDNYGATMQAYATYKAIKELGHEAEFIDLRLPYKPSLKQRIVFGLKRRRFNRFRKKYFKNLTPRTYWSLQELRDNPPASDCYLVGSDQTLNPQIGKRLLPAFFLTFGSPATRRVSYATSIGLNEWEESPYISNQEISKAVAAFDNVMLREDSAINICKNIFGREAQQVIDPVLLFPNYNELTGDLKASGEIVTYKLTNDEGFYDIAGSVSLKMHLPIRSIGSIRRIPHYKGSYPESVEQWINRIANASLVLTDSFHGTVFSLLYHRPFVIYVGLPNRVTRIKSLLSQLGLDNRILHNGATAEDMCKIAETPIDWVKIDEKLSMLREDSISRLKDALS